MALPSAESLAPYRFVVVPAAVLVVSALLLFTRSSRRRRRRSQPYPPSPASLPIIGHAHLLMSAESPYVGLTEIGEQLQGDIFRIVLGATTNVVVSDPLWVQKAFLGEGLNYACRPEDQTLDIFPESLIFSKFGPRVIRTRKMLHNFVSAPVALKALEDSIIRQERLETLRALLSWPSSQQCIAKELMTRCTLNVIAQLTLGRRWDDPSDPELLRLRNLLDSDYKTFAEFNLANMYPMLKPLPLQAKRNLQKLRQKAIPIFSDLIGKVRQQRAEGNAAAEESFVGSLLKIQEAGGDDSMTDTEMVMLLSDMLTAGSDTTAITLTCLIGAVICDPEIQRKAQEELDAVLGNSRLPSMEDLPNLPYLNALVLETLRKYPVIPLVARRSAKDTEIAGYAIDEGDVVIANIWSIHHNPKLWTSPNTYDPSRFLHSDESSRINQPSNMFAFGEGRRVCPGMKLAKQEVFLVAGALLQCFEFSSGREDGALPDLKLHFGISCCPSPFPIAFKLRPDREHLIREE
ncbi:cytochrome P450 [Polychytrium aggregatum]|uniref:cytochrome P450 n=1 Tax=Polychytrium aggregatum TaxID=110093 RepID=UPI0022FE0DD7|nr:cytochrome P450 [Polychytrium aggregatum]KAI9204020.1 cytochrome P450 [Polychytrium aggregatum]